MNESITVAALAEMIHNEIIPKPGDYAKIDIEDIVEKVRNAYSAALWQLYMQNLNDGERLLNTVVLERKKFIVSPDAAQLELTGLQITDLPRDAGMYAVISDGPGCGRKGGIPLLRSTPEAAYMTPSRIPINKRYYRIKNELHFPEGLPPKTTEVHVVFYGLNEDNEWAMSRGIAELVHKDVKAQYAQTLQVNSDVTPNINPNI